MDTTNDMDESKILKRLVEIIECDLREMFDAENNILSFDKIPDHVKRCIESFDVTESPEGARMIRKRSVPCWVEYCQPKLRVNSIHHG